MGGVRHRLAVSVTAIARALANPEIRRIELSWMLAIASQWALTVALLVYAFDAGGEVAVGILGIARTIPGVAGVPLAASLADRIPRIRVLQGAHVVSFVAATACVVALAVEASLPVILALAGANAIAAMTVRPIQSSLLPSLARTPEELVASNVATSTLEGVGGILGPLLAGAVLGIGLAPAAAVAAVGVLGAVLLTSRVRTVELPRERGRSASIASGILVLRDAPAPRNIVFLLAMQLLTRGLLNVFLVVASLELLGLGDEGVSVLSTALGVGGLVGVVVTVLMIGQPRLMPFGLAALVLWGLPISVIGATGAAPIAFLMMGVIGAANAVEDVALFGGLQRVVPHRVRSSVLGAAEGILAVSAGIGGILGSTLVGALGIGPAMIVGGLMLPAAALLRTRAVLAADDVSLVPARELALLRGIPMFAPLPITTVEEIAGRVETVRFGAGEALMREGEPGDRYLVIATGRARVTIGGETVREMGPGDGVGEIALLRDLPRTATVTALEPVEALALDGPGFVAAVTGDELAAGAARGVVEARLSAAAD